MCDTIYTFECNLEKCTFKASIGEVACKSCLENGECNSCTNYDDCVLKINCITNKCRVKKLQFPESRDVYTSDDFLPTDADISG